MKGAFVGKKGF